MRPDNGIQNLWLDRLTAAEAYNEWISAHLEEHLGGEVLEIGCRVGTFPRLLAASGCNVLAVDIDAGFVEAAQAATAGLANVGIEGADVAEAAWRECFDTTVMLEVLEHIEGDLAIVRRLNTALVAPGRLVIKVPAMPALHGVLDRAVGHHRRYTARGLESAMREAGFVGVRTWHFNVAGAAAWWLNRRLLGRERPPLRRIAAFDAMVPVCAGWTCSRDSASACRSSPLATRRRRRSERRDFSDCARWGPCYGAVASAGPPSPAIPDSTI